MSKSDKKITSADLEESARQLQEAAKKEREAARMEREAAQKEKEAAKILRQAARQAAKEERKAKKKAKQVPLSKETDEVASNQTNEETVTEKEETTSAPQKQEEVKETKSGDKPKETSQPSINKDKNKKSKRIKENPEVTMEEKTTLASSPLTEDPTEEKESSTFFKYINYILITLIVLTILLVGLVLLTQTSVGKQAWSKIQQPSLFGNSSQTEKEDEPKVDPNALKINSNHINSADEYAYSTKEIREYITDQKESDEKIVFLTFDDGVASGYTDKVLDTLAEYEIHGTFFLIGNNLQNEEVDIDYTHRLVKRQIEEGHAVAIHTMSHDMETLYPGRVPYLEQIVSEAKEEQELLKSIIGDDFKTSVFRYPGGHLSWAGLEETDNALEAAGLEWIDWNASVGDAEPNSRRPTDLESMLKFHSTSSSDFPETPIKVVLMHDTFGKDLTVEVLPQIIEYYQNEGYKFGILE